MKGHNCVADNCHSDYGFNRFSGSESENISLQQTTDILNNWAVHDGKNMSNAYEDAYRRSLQDPEGFWAEAAGDVDWIKPWDKVLDDSDKPFYRWFVGAECNTCYNALDRHILSGRGEQVALIYDSPVTGESIKKYTYSDLRDQAALFAGVLRAQGVVKGDRVIL